MPQTLHGLTERYEVQGFKTLGLTDDKTARELLEKTAWQVQPIMRRRQWKARALRANTLSVAHRTP